MANNKKRKAPAKSKSFDVFRPNNITPQATSRPIIIANKPEQTDPMVNEPTEQPQMLPIPEKVPELPSNTTSIGDDEALAGKMTTDTVEATTKPESESPEIAEPKQQSSSAPNESDTVVEQKEDQKVSKLAVEEHQNEPAPSEEVDSTTNKPVVSFHLKRSGSKSLKWFFIGLLVLGLGVLLGLYILVA